MPGMDFWPSTGNSIWLLDARPVFSGEFAVDVQVAAIYPEANGQDRKRYQNRQDYYEFHLLSLRFAGFSGSILPPSLSHFYASIA